MGPQPTQESPFPQNDGSDPLPLSSTTGTPESSRGTNSRCGRLLGGHLVKPMLFTPFFPTVSLRGSTCLCVIGSSSPLHNWWFYSWAALLITLFLELYYSLPSPSFHLGVLPRSSAACREGKKGERKGEGKARKYSCLMFTYFTLWTHSILVTTLGGKHCYPIS